MQQAVEIIFQPDSISEIMSKKGGRPRRYLMYSFVAIMTEIVAFSISTLQVAMSILRNAHHSHI